MFFHRFQVRSCINCKINHALEKFRTEVVENRQNRIDRLKYHVFTCERILILGVNRALESEYINQVVTLVSLEILK